MKSFIPFFLSAAITLTFLFILPFSHIHAEEGKRIFFTKYSFSGHESGPSFYEGGRLPPSEKKGMKTYVFSSEITILPSLTNVPLALVLGSTYYYTEISVNNFNIYSHGIYKNEAVSYEYNTVAIPIDHTVIKNSSSVALRMTIRLEDERFPLPECYLTSYSLAASDSFWRTFFNTNLYQAAFVVAMVISLYFLFMFFSQRRPLYAFICCMAFTFAWSFVEIVFNYASCDTTLLLKISRISFPFTSLFVFFFTTEFTGLLKNNRLKIINSAIFLTIAVLTLIAPTQYGINMIFNYTILFYIVPNLLLTLGIVITSVIKNRFRKNIPILLAFLVVLFTSVHDMVFFLTDKIPYAYLSTDGYLFLVVSIFFILAGEQSDLYKNLLIANKEVAELNVNLEKKVEERTSELKDLSLRDPLTGLRNRRYITEFVVEIVESFKKSKIMALKNNLDRRDLKIANKVIGIIILDIDYFKKVNDTHGHDTGDKVLIFLADKLKRIVRTDDIIIRWGGEEFFIVLNRTVPEYIPEFCRKVLNLFRNTNIEIDEAIHISSKCSIGCVSYPVSEDYPDSISFEKSMILCDMALYLAKENGRDRAVIIEIDKELMNNGDVKSRMSIPQDIISINDPIFKKRIII